MTKLSMTEVSSSSDFSWLPMIDDPIGERMIGELTWRNGTLKIVDEQRNAVAVNIPVELFAGSPACPTIGI